MADPYELMELEGYNRGPDAHMRNQKLQMEEELLIKLGAKREMIELHPLILSSRLERAKTFTDLQYSRATPPATERSYVSRNPWHSSDQALRQMSNPSRRGPRDFVLPNLVKSTSNVKVECIPEADHDFFARREVILDRLHKLLDEWAVYERRAFPPLINRLSTLKELVPIKPVKELTKANLNTLSTDRGKKKSFYSWSTSSNQSSSEGRKKTRRRAEHRKKTRWSRMTQEALLQMKASHIRLPFFLPRSELRVYVSSTPDLHEEREFLEEVAYPKLKELCEKIGLNCHFVDMRKGSGFLCNDVETFDLIDKELKNCRELSIGPHFVSLLGHQLDDQKLPGFLEKAIYEKIRKTLVKEHIIGVEMFDEAYRLDSNRTPAVYVKQPLRAINEYQGPEHVEQILLTALNSALSHMKENAEDGKTEDFYKWSAVVREVEGGLLKSHNPKRETLCFMFDPEKPPDPDDEPDLSSPVERLRNNVTTYYGRTASKASLMSFKYGRKTISYLRSLSDTFIASMASMLKSQVRHNEYDVTQQMTEGSEALQHVRIALSEADVVADNSNLLAKVHDIIQPEEENPKIILLVGPQGSGKTVLASHIAKSSLLWDPRRKVMFRCLGMTLRSSSLFRTLESLTKQLNFLYSLDNPVASDSNLNGAISTFCETLRLVSDSRKGRGNLLLVLDHLEKFRDVDIHVLLKIINSVYDGIALVFSFDVSHPFTAVLKSHPAVETVTLVPFNKIEINDFMKQKLSLSKRQVTQDQMKTVLKSLPDDPTPVYFEMVSNIIKCWPSHTLPELENFSGVAESDFMVYLDMLERELGKAFTRYALSLLAASRHGLSDSELVHLLAEDGQLLNEIKTDETVSVVEGFSYQLQLSRLISLLGKFVVEIKIEGETVFKLICNSLSQCIHEKYLKKDFFHAIHNRLATFFLFIRRGMLLSSKDISEKRYQDLSKYQWRMMRCVPYHLCFSSSDPDQVWATLKEKVFFNFSWLVNEIYSGFYIDLMDDIRFALEHVDLDPDIQYLQQFLVSIHNTAIHNPLSLASVFACQNIQESDDEVKDSVHDVVKEARIWLKQVHTQALIPVEYTMDKINRLLIKKNSLRMVTDMWTNSSSANLIVQREKSLFLSNMVTGEETKLFTFENDISLVHLGNNNDIFVSTIDSDNTVQIDVFNLKKGKNVHSMSLNRQDIKWVDFRSTTEIYASNDEGISQINVEDMKSSNIWAQKKPWLDSYITQGKVPRTVTVTMEDKMKIQLLTMKTLSLKMISFKKSGLNPYCKPMLSTRDGKYLVMLFEREAVVIDLIKSEETETFSHNGLPIIGAELSRSHEHIFLAYINGSITCHVLYSGNTSLITKINTRISLSRDSSTLSPGKSESRNQSSPSRSASPSKHRSPKHKSLDSDLEKITTMTTSEDDHFLFCGTNTGFVYVIYVPTGHQIVAILTPHRPIKKVLYLNNREHFQHLITLNEDGLAFHWNLRPLIKQARILVKPYIHDADLLKEEQSKIQLRQYYKNYVTRWADRVFLNGPDISAFYKDPPQDIFTPLEKLDPAFKPVTDWEKTGTFADCIEMVKVFACGRELGDILMTISTDMRLARWSLFDGRLVWCKKLTFGYGIIQNAALVYYDQALMVTEKNVQDSRLSITVVYLGDGQTKIMTRHNVTGYWTSQDRCQVLILCQDQGKEEDVSFYHWDLLNGSEEERHYSEMMFEENVSRDNLLFTTISPGLNQVLRLSLVDKNKPETKDTDEGKDVKIEDTSLQRTHTFPEMSLRKGAMGLEGRFSTAMNRSSISISIENLLANKNLPIPESETEIKESTPTKQVRFQTSNQIIPNESDKTASGQENEGDGALSEGFDMNIMLTWNLFKTKGNKNRAGASKKVDNNLQGGSPLLNSSSSLSKSMENISPTHEDVFEDEPQNRDTHTEKPEEEMGADQPAASKVEKESSTLEDDSEKQADKLQKNWCFLKLDLSAICFTGEENVLTGTMTGHVMLLNIPTFHIACVLTVDGPRLLPVETLESALANVSSPHRGSITYVGTSDDESLLVSADARTVCLWNNMNRLLVMVIQFDVGQELTHMIFSKDAAVVAIVTNNRIIHVWTSIGSPRELASYMMNFDILDLGMSSDCHKIIARGRGHENETLLEIFEVKNIDDVLMHVQSRKQSSNDEERRRSRSQSQTQTQGSRRRMSRRTSEQRRLSVSSGQASGQANSGSQS